MTAWNGAETRKDSGVGRDNEWYVVLRDPCDDDVSVVRVHRGRDSVEKALCKSVRNSIDQEEMSDFLEARETMLYQFWRVGQWRVTRVDAPHGLR